MSALRQHLESLPPHEREEISLDRYAEQETLAQRFSCSSDIVRLVLKEIERTTTVTGRAVLRTWHEAVLIHRALSATEKVAALRVWCFVNSRHLYAWPSQDRLAKELGYSRGPNLGKALKRTFEIGAFTPVAIKNLPSELREQATGESHRSLRGIAYRLNPLDRWAGEAAAFAALQDGNMFHSGTFECSKMHHLNCEGNYEPASPDSLAYAQEINQQTFPQVEPSQLGNDVVKEGARHG